jgi:hypothetical protein
MVFSLTIGPIKPPSLVQQKLLNNIFKNEIQSVNIEIDDQPMKIQIN